MVKRVSGRSPRESPLRLAPLFSQYREIAGETTTRVSVFRLDSSGLIYIATSYSAPRHFRVYTRAESSRARSFAARLIHYLSASQHCVSRPKTAGGFRGGM